MIIANGLIIVVVCVCAAILIFLLIRRFWCWYFKLTEMSAHLKDTVTGLQCVCRHLKTIEAILGKNPDMPHELTNDDLVSNYKKIGMVG
jgi:hypothetical protein